MGSHVTKIITQYLPNTLLKLKYDPNTKSITLITFSDRNTSKIHNHTGVTLRKCTQSSAGCTYMTDAIENLRKVIIESKCNQFRILTISDGDLHDQYDTVNAATKLASEIHGKYIISSSAVRLFTSSQQPDTRGLASILQLNNTNDGSTSTKIIDFNCNTIPEEFVNVFTLALTDNLGSNVRLLSILPIFMIDPWSKPRSEIYLSEGNNMFWLSSNYNEHAIISIQNDNIEPTIEPTIEPIIVPIERKQVLDLNNFDFIMKSKLDSYVERLKILKVVDMAESKKEIEQIINYFTQLERRLIANTKFDDDVDISQDTSIQTRLKFLKNRVMRKSKSFIQEMSVVANHEKVSQLNSAQQADFLRSAIASSNAVNLAKRGIKQSLDFDTKAIEEVKQMNIHLHEIIDIDDSQHAVSFYSQATTLEGIRTVCALADENNSLDQLTALEILSLLNIVIELILINLIELNYGPVLTNKMFYHFANLIEF